MMKENDIRPSELKDKTRRLFEKEASKLLCSEKKFVEVDCPACAAKNKKLYFSKDGYKFKKCSSCRSVYISPRPTAELLKDYYSNSEASKFWQAHIFKKSKEARVEKIYKPRADIILEYAKRYGITTGILLEVGAGSGFFGMEMAARSVFKKIILVEPGPIEMDNSESLIIINDVIENVGLDEKPDVVVSFELIEHLFSPYELLKKVYKLMAPNSFIMLTTPNIEGFELMSAWEASTNLAGPDHLNYFNTDSIKALYERVGFKPVAVDTPGELDADIIRNMHMEGHIDISSQRFLHYMLIEKPDKYIDSFQGFLQRMKLSSHMLAVAKKDTIRNKL